MLVINQKVEDPRGVFYEVSKVVLYEEIDVQIIVEAFSPMRC